jgi:hypothetical protein
MDHARGAQPRVYEHKSAAGAVYRAVLRTEVRERLPWVWWRQSGRGLFEIEGVPNAVLREFSRRRVEIEERALEQRERERYAPPEPQRTATETVETLTASMRRHEPEQLAMNTVEPELAATERAETPRVPLTELAEAGAEQASAASHRGPPPEIRGPDLRRTRDAWHERERGIER